MTFLESLLSDCGYQMKIVIDTLGCKLNQAETEVLSRQVVQAGYELIERPEDADVYILNTCTVTHAADAKSRHLLRMVHRRNPGAVIIAAGCYAHRTAVELEKIEGVSYIVNNSEKDNIIQLLQKLQEKVHFRRHLPDTTTPLRTRSFLKIQDGCSNFCAYCIVPFVRSSESSVPIATVITEIQHRAAEGYQEVVLTGTRIGSYNFSGLDLKDLLERILVETNIPRIRLSSLQPQEMTPELVKLWENNRLCPHFHLSLQSGSGSVLERMKRRYTPEKYLEAVNMIRAIVPSVAITTDIIVGFPGETDKEFEESLAFCRKVGFARIHVFKYSPRSGTLAAAMTGQVSDKIKKERSQQMLALAKESTRQFKENFTGISMDVLWEKQSEDGEWSGITGNYIRVYARSDKNLSNKLLPTELK